MVKQHPDSFKKLLDRSVLVSLVIGTQTRRPSLKTYPDDKSLNNAIMSSGQSLTAKADQIIRIKSAIAKANVENTVVVNGVEMSIAEAIIRKNYVAELETILATYRRQFLDTQKIAEAYEAQTLAKMDPTTPADMVASFKDSLDKLHCPVILAYKGSSSTPAEHMEAMAVQIEFLKSELDTVLSEANINIKVELEL
jgi:hypothetical protein